MSLSPQQETAAAAIMDWLNVTARMSPYEYGEDWMFCLAGYAGSGKTFLLGELISRLGCTFHCVAPTGKAASVLMSKLKGIEVNTIHSLLYSPMTDDIEKVRKLMAQCVEHPDDEELKKQLSEEVAKINSRGPGFATKENCKIQPGDFVIVDESSMVDERLREDLMKTSCRCLFVGDSGQLPPVGSSGWFIKRKPNARLDEIHRQALDNPIIRLSMDIRDGVAKPRDWRRKEGCGMWTTDEVDPALWLKADQIITGSNASRHKINRFFRRQLGYSNQSNFPVAGEKLICLKNDNRRIPQFINGTQFKSTGDSIEELRHDGVGVGFLDVCYEGVDLPGVQYYLYHCQSVYSKSATDVPREFRRGLMELDFGYAITVHKSQGSEWDKVIVADDGMMKGDPVFRRRWLYTAVTRAKSDLMIIQSKS